MAVRQALALIGEPCGDMLDRFFARDQSYRTIGDELSCRQARLQAAFPGVSRN